jgi:hypothetical protein
VRDAPATTHLLTVAETLRAHTAIGYDLCAASLPTRTILARDHQESEEEEDEEGVRQKERRLPILNRLSSFM